MYLTCRTARAYVLLHCMETYMHTVRLLYSTALHCGTGGGDDAVALITGMSLLH